MMEKLTASQEEARLMARLVTAYSSAQDVVAQLHPVLEGFGLLKPSGFLDADRVLEIYKRAREL